ncbi:protein of unknown function DUF326 [Gloeothece citriformis PCC 7424]|uniref:Ferredoxin n=1 Tax=Gloeothece citriformis (strain PCC 7424) TaxID=65393 RepID=B7K9G9_GLOC7|nr:four-helix bundle copper-binding protein [Gloeothece citriformis]ACK68652.1 protein of unknown function DUF326 [Gloeothece citriformis PCC 7424]
MPAQQHESILDAAILCAKECEHCADACLDENNNMAECIRLCRDCSQMCWVSAGYISRGSRFIPQIVRSCIEICQACASECEKHDDDHCQKCAQTCRQAAEEYQKVANVAGVA